MVVVVVWLVVFTPSVPTDPPISVVVVVVVVLPLSSVLLVVTVVVLVLELETSHPVSPKTIITVRARASSFMVLDFILYLLCFD